MTAKRAIRWPGAAVVAGWLAVIGVVAVACAAADGRPTASAVIDPCWRIAFGVLLALAGARAKPWAWLVAGAIVAATTGSVGLVAGFGALLLAVAAAWWRTRHPLIGAAIGGGIAVAALHLRWPSSFGAASAVATIVAGILLASAASDAPRPARRVAGAVLLLVVAAIALPSVMLLREQHRITEAISAGNSALAAARRGDTTAAGREFAEAGALVDAIGSPTRAWWARPALAVPVVAQHLRGLDHLLAIASDLAAAGTRTSRSADVSSIRPVDGRIDLPSLQAFDAPLRDLEGSLAGAHRAIAEVRSPWLVDAFTTRIERLDRQVVTATADARRARDAVEVLPSLLGGDGERRYLLAVMTPSELRGVGGVMGNWGILTADQGRLHLGTFDRVDRLLRPEPYAISVTPEYDARYVRGWGLERYVQNLLASPDLASTAEAGRQVLEQAGYGDIDGMIAVDPYFMAGLLRITGPVDVTGWSTPLTADNAAQLLLHDQYADGDIQDPARPGLLSRTTHALFERLTSGPLASVSTIVDTLGPTVRARHVQMTSFDPVTERFLVRSGLSRRLGPPAVDAMHLVTESASNTKLAWFLRRSLRYQAKVDPTTGATTATVTVVLRNTAPTNLTSDFYQDTYDHLPMGVDVQVVSIYTGLALTGVTLDGAPVDSLTATEDGLNVHDRFVTLPPGGTTTVVFALRGELPIQRGAYRLDVHRQPTVAPDDLTVVVNGRTLFDGPQDHDLVLRSRLR